MRWFVCALLFAIVALNYVDRQVLSVLKPTLQQHYGWSETGYGDVVFWFQAAYGLGYVAFGRIVDRFGAKVGGTIAVTFWTIAHMAHALVTSIVGFTLVRIPMGLGESGLFPCTLAADRGMVSPARARAGHRHLQCRLQCRRHPGALHRAHHHPGLGLADGLHPHRPLTFRLAGGMADLVSPPARASAASARAELAYIESDPPQAQRPVPWCSCSPPARPGPIWRDAS